MRLREGEIIPTAELIDVRNQISEIEKKLEKLPEGKLLCKKNGNSIQWYKSNHYKPIYIKKSERKYAADLAQRTFLEAELTGLYQEEKLLEEYEILHQKNNDEKKVFFKEKTGFNELLKSSTSLPAELLEWANANFEGNSFKEEEKRYETLDGHFVRSKSEIMIADALYENGIPYRYEAPITIANHRYYPDFTVRKPGCGKEMIWEHFGMMDIYKYRNSAISKIGDYLQNGYVPGVDFIMTFETQDVPLTSVAIRGVIRQHLL